MKARKKIERAVELENRHADGPSTPRALNPLLSPARENRSTRLVTAHFDMMNRLPKPLHGMLPSLPPTGPINPGSLDYSRFIEWLKLPRFATQDTAPNWLNYFATGIRHVRQHVVNSLSDIVESGAEPQDRQTDLFFAWWEFQFVDQKQVQPMPSLQAEAEDAAPAMTPEQVQRARNLPDVAAATRRFGDGALRLKIGEWNQRSVLGLLSYAVGWSGPPKNRRRAALDACMILPEGSLPESQRYFWGAPATRRRARSILRMIELFIALAQKRTHGDWSRACDDWRNDAGWVEATWLTSRSA